MKQVAVLFARQDSIYKGFDLADVWDIERDARGYRGDFPVVAHPPCRAWGRLRKFAKPRSDEKDLAFFAVDQVRKYGGVLEHPAQSSLWPAAGLPSIGERDVFGGWTLCVDQNWWGHRARKRTYLYIVGIEPKQLPSYPLVLGQAPAVIAGNSRHRTRNLVHLPYAEREKTPLFFARWLFDLASMTKGVN